MLLARPSARILGSLTTLAVMGAAACGSDAAGTSSTNQTGPDGGAATTQDGGAPNAGKCGRVAKPADRARKVVVSHPFLDANGAKANKYEVLDLSATGELSRPGTTFEMHRAVLARVDFTVDGALGFVPQDDGSIGVIAFDESGAVRVVDEGFTGDFYAKDIMLSADGDRLYAIQQDTDANGGGVHEIEVGCDGKLTYKSRIVPGGRAHRMTLLPNEPGKALLLQYRPFNISVDTYAHRIDLSVSPPERIASGDVWGDDLGVASGVAVTLDGKHALITDNSFQKGSRMASIDLTTMTKGPTIDTPNPAGVIMSPFGNVALLMNSEGEDALRVVSYDAANTAAPFTIGSEVAYVGGKTQLPFAGHAFSDGQLKGRVLVAENTAIRSLQFAADGTVTDLGVLEFGDEIPDILGAFGVQP